MSRPPRWTVTGHLDPKEVRSRLKRARGALLIEQFPTNDNAALIELAKGLGHITPPGLGQLSNHPLEDGYVYRVECKGDGLRGPAGSTVHSTAPTMFSCHTDGFGSLEPPVIVILLCVRPDPHGGDSLVASVDDIVARMRDADVSHLRSAIYPNGEGCFPILFNLPGDRIGARFNLPDLLFFAERSSALPDTAHIDAAVRFGAIADEVALLSAFRLQTGDCLILDNRIVLHGRTAVARDSLRLLKRIRIYRRAYPRRRSKDSVSAARFAS